ncbi:hypothetical protein [Burkholderia ubonensis]|nr:hypothetical protein [Burkholderia ubonensis]
MHSFTAIFFPAIAKGRDALRIMIRANMQRGDVRRFATRLNPFKVAHE